MTNGAPLALRRFSPYLLMAILAATRAFAQNVGLGTAFTYQGLLQSGGTLRSR